ncbi:hypothetical protein [Jannaschia sp. R86511]|uniref:hypothetical protein n=1 Tax=Jannaschia sp. R86511 TaxID=3093853 RepID=UPI0036D344C3
MSHDPPSSLPPRGRGLGPLFFLGAALLGAAILLALMPISGTVTSLNMGQQAIPCGTALDTYTGYNSGDCYQVGATYRTLAGLTGFAGVSCWIAMMLRR